MEPRIKQEIARKVVSQTLLSAGRTDLAELFCRNVPPGPAESMLYFILFMRYRAKMLRSPENLQRKILCTLEGDIAGLSFFRARGRRAGKFWAKVSAYAAIFSEKDFEEVYLLMRVEELEKASWEENRCKCLSLCRELDAAWVDLNRLSAPLVCRYAAVVSRIHRCLYN
ncbi:hypothetical protein V9K67_24565 [Paraflavisolibacter sp. H34]|uniref:hypothetical protein n=1 Tax=Huijunlia imazamoxiresistens TaxID=3127457 RepID=UPI00301773E6